MFISRFIKVFVILFVISIINFPVSSSENKETKPVIKMYPVKYTKTPPKIDGVYDSVWDSAVSTGKFTQWNGEPAPQETTARLLWDENNLYLIFQLKDSDIRATMTERDKGLFVEEVIELFVDANGDSLNYQEIEVNPLGTIFDLNIGKAFVKHDSAWDAEGMLTAVKVDGEVSSDVRKGEEAGPGSTADTTGWSVEMAIPWKNFMEARNLPPKDGDCWRANLYRCDNWPGKTYDAWNPTMTEKPNFHIPAAFGRICFRK
jgi:Carbohydrate-binding family 9